MFSEFKDKLIYNILFENDYLTKLISTNSMKKIMKRIDFIVDLERKELFQISKGYKEKIGSVNEKLKSLSKLDLYFPSEEIFWGIMTYVSNLARMKIELHHYSSFISFELVKNTTGFNFNNLLKEAELLNDLDSERKEVKAAELDSIFRDNFGNPDKFFINVLFNDKIISQLSLNSLRQHIKTNLLSTQEVEAFCFPKKMSASNIFILLLISFVIFEILILACIYTIKS
jgi:plasmid maintenance system killer protein